MDIAALKKLALAANQSEWKWDGRTVDEEGYVYIPECSYLVGLVCLAGDYEGYQNDCDFMAAAQPKNVLALIASHEQLVAALREVLKHEEWHAASADEVTDEARAAIKQTRAALAAAGAA